MFGGRVVFGVSVWCSVCRAFGDGCAGCGFVDDDLVGGERVRSATPYIHRFCLRVSFSEWQLHRFYGPRGAWPSHSATRQSHWASIRTARFIVAGLRPASFQMLSLISRRSVRCGFPASSRSMASRSRFAARGGTPSPCLSWSTTLGSVLTRALYWFQSCAEWVRLCSTRAVALLCGRSTVLACRYLPG
jgi:hypothetical protein